MIYTFFLPSNGEKSGALFLLKTEEGPNDAHPAMHESFLNCNLCIYLQHVLTGVLIYTEV